MTVVNSLLSLMVVMDAELGEILVTCEKLKWTIENGEKALSTESRSTSMLTMQVIKRIRITTTITSSLMIIGYSHKKALVEYLPLGVVSALVSWNYP